MSKVTCNPADMKQLTIQIKMSPELEAIAGNLTPEQRLAMARKLPQWKHELEFTGKLLIWVRNRKNFRRAVLPRFPKGSGAKN